MSRIAAMSASNAARHWAVATGVRVVSFCAVSGAVSAACVWTPSPVSAAAGIFYAAACIPATATQSFAMLNCPVRVPGIQSVF
jgi:hypothetical protein